MNEQEQETYEGGAELAIRTSARAIDMRDRSTDSWTDVVQDVSRLSIMIANTEFVPKGLRGSDAKVAAAILYSRELGLAPMTGLGGVHVIEGSAGISAELMRALILQAGHELQIPEMTREKCVIRGRRQGQEEWTTSTWTMGEAALTKVFISKEKGWQPISSKTLWKSFPSEMLLARATTRLARMIFPDVIHGMRSVEELQDMSVSVDEVEGPPAAPVVQRRQAPARSPHPAAPAQQEAAEVPERRRVGRPAPKTVEAVQEAPAPSEPVEDDAPVVTTIEAEPVPDADGVVDAEIIPEAAGEEPIEFGPRSGAESAKARKGATTATIMHFERLGVTDRAERIWYTGVIAGRQIESTNDLALDDLRKVVHVLERAKNIEAINALVDKAKS